ncbi:MAG: HAD hydrolase-like protein, partial [Synergistaceae bacterium]|nr:HAD hydrolase-like protein [Synergistaceae bacterium]
SDIQTGINAGLRTALLESGYGTARLEFDVKPDFIFADLREFAVFLSERGVER